MARFGAGQYEDAFTPHRLQNWNVPRSSRQRPTLQDGPTQIITNDRGHLLPTVPRSQASPWGTFVGTWEMPPRIPPARLSLTSRSAAAAARLTAWTRQPTALSRACNGVRTEITGKEEPTKPPLSSKREAAEDRGCPDAEGLPASPAPLFRSPHGCTAGLTLVSPAQPEEPHAAARTAQEPSQRSDQAPSEGTELRRGDTASPQISAPREPSPGGATAPGGEEGEAAEEPERGQRPTAPCVFVATGKNKCLTI